jgi:hypothetical protein
LVWLVGFRSEILRFAQDDSALLVGVGLDRQTQREIGLTRDLHREGWTGGGIAPILGAGLRNPGHVQAPAQRSANRVPANRLQVAGK